MAESETTVLLAVFNDISEADHAIDMFWEWVEGENGSGPDAIGVLVNHESRLDAQLIGDESGFGEETGAMLDILERLLAENRLGTAEFEDSYTGGADALIAMLGLEDAFIDQLRRELNAGHAILILTPRPADLESSREQLENLDGRTTLLSLSRTNLIRAAAALDVDELDDDFEGDYDDADSYDYDYDDDEYDDDYDYDDEEYDDDYDSRNGRYR
jgi:hypothetical protein